MKNVKKEIFIHVKKESWESEYSTVSYTHLDVYKRQGYSHN